VHRVNPLKSLSVKLGLVLFVVVAVALAITYLAVVPRLETRLVDNTLESLRRSAPLIVNALAANDPENTTKLFAEQLSARVVVYQRLTPETLGVYADSSDLGSNDVVNDPIALESARADRLAEGRVDRDGREYAEVARLFGDESFVLLLSAPLAERLSAVSVVKRDILIFGGVALAVSWLVGAVAALVFVRRIRRLEAAAERIAGGDFDVVVADRSEDELGELARTFDRMRSRLSSLDRARREFVANASHELRTPLFALGGFLELLADEELDERTRRDFLETARSQVERLTRLATDLLDLSRLDAGQLDVETAPLDLGSTAEALVEEFRGLAEGGGHGLRLASDDEVVAIGDEERVLQIGRSLVENALRHTPAGTLVEVDAGVEGEQAILTVRDDGPGVSPEDQDRVFERFYRGGGAASGSGIGLAIARELASLMNGTITLSSRPGATSFRLVLPRAPSPAPFSRENALLRT
jgi:two-component system OmpR family sensor kinase